MPLKEVKKQNRVIVHTDIHLFGPHQLMTPQEFLDQLKQESKDGEIIILLGDIVDLAGCKRSEVDDALSFIDQITQYVEVYIYGNHELVVSDDNYVQIGTNLLAHGDWEWWGQDKTLRYRDQKRGAIFPKRLVSSFFEGMRRQWQIKPTERFIRNLARLDCAVYYCGHKHPPKTVSFVVDGKLVVCLSRGRHELQLL